MSLEILLTFIAATALLALTPGPAMSLILASSASRGTRAGMLTVAGNSTGLAALVIAATFGMTTVMVLMAEWFDWIRFIGAAYLVWLGGRKLYSAWKDESGLVAPARRRSGPFWQGLGVALSNPKVLLFLGAFLPQFVNVTTPLVAQYMVLAATFIVTVTLIDGGYALFAGSAKRCVRGGRGRVIDAITGVFLIGGGALLALRRG